jgi:hypothetical protein
MDTKEIKTTNARTHEQAVDIARARSKAENGRILDARERYIPNAKVVINSLIHDMEPGSCLGYSQTIVRNRREGSNASLKTKTKPSIGTILRAPFDTQSLWHVVNQVFLPELYFMNVPTGLFQHTHTSKMALTDV